MVSRLLQQSILIAILIANFSSSPASAQSPLYLDASYNTCPRDSAIYVAAFSMETGTRYKVQIREKKTTHVHATGYSTSNKEINLRDDYTEYYDRKQPKTEGRYHNGTETGLWKHYRKIGGKLWWTYNYDTHILTTCGSDGKPCREETIDKRGQKTKKCFDEHGKTLETCPTETLPEPATDLNTFIAANLQYPPEAARHNAGGKVVLQFAVAPDGSLDNITVIKSVHPALDREAMRILRKMPRWRPAMQGGVPVATHFSLPIILDPE